MCETGDAANYVGRDPLCEISTRIQLATDVKPSLELPT